MATVIQKTYADITQLGASDDMHVLNILVEQVQGLMPVSGNAEELGVPDTHLFHTATPGAA